MSLLKMMRMAVAVLVSCVALALSAQTPSLTTLNAIHALTNAEASRNIPVEFEATVTYYRAYERTMFVQDGDVAIYVQTTTGLRLMPGDRVVVRGTTHESFRPFVMAVSVDRLRHDELPKPAGATFDDMIHSRYDCRLVTVRALVRAADVANLSRRNSSLQLLMDGGDIDATLDADDAGMLKGMLDAEVELTGVASGKFDGKMQLTGVLLHVTSIANIKVLNRAKASPWSLPVTPMNEVLTVYHVVNQTQRVRVQGTITYYQPGSAVILQNGARSLWIMVKSRDDLHIGDLADATGIPDVHDGFLTLTHGEVQDSGVQVPVQPRISTWTELSQSHQLFDLVSIQGKVVTAVREGAQDEYVLEAEGQIFSAIVRHPTTTFSSTSPPPLPFMKQIAVGSSVQVTGVCILEDANPFDANVPFNLMMRSYDDIRVIAQPSWLSVRNLVRVLTLTLLLMLAIAGWGWTLRRKVKVQSAALARGAEAEAERERKNARLQQQRSRILEDINGTRPLVEVLEQITELVSFQLNGAPCWCEITDGARLGRHPGFGENLRIIREPIPARSGPPLGMLYAGLDAHASFLENENEAFFVGSRLATLAIETRRLYSDLVHRSEFDLLTDVHNRFSLDKKMETLIARAREEASLFGLIYVDLDDFKQVNDLCGHRAGDLYLQEVVVRMKRQLRSGDLLARLGGDEFAALVPIARNRADVEEIAARLEQCFALPFVVEGHALRGSASLGVALYPEDGTTKDSLLSAADAAMYVAKHTKHANAG